MTEIPAFRQAVKDAVRAGLAAAAILDHEGRAFATAGALDADAARALTRTLRSPDLLARMHDGELIGASLDDRPVCVGVARCVFVVVAFGATPAGSAVDNLCITVEQVISEIRSQSSGQVPWTSGTGGSSSGPADMPMIDARKSRN